MAKLYKRGKVWWVDYSDYLWRRKRKSTRCTDKEAALAMLANFLTYEQHLRAGIMVVSREHKKMPFERHVKDWAKSRAADKPDEGDRLYIRKAARFLNLAAQSCGWQTLGDMTKASVTRYLEERSTTPNEHGDMPASKTIANFASYLHAFGDWCVEDERMVTNPCPHPGRWSKAAKFPRRALTDKELRSLLTCETIPASRRATYALLVVLGLRKTAAAYVTPDMVSVDDDGQTWVNVPVYVWVFKDGLVYYTKNQFSRCVRLSKSGQPMKIPVPSHVVPMLRAMIDGKPGNRPFLERGLSAALFQSDLRSAGVNPIDYLGRKAVLHSTRMTGNTLMAICGVSTSARMRLFGWSDPRFAENTYMDRALLDGPAMEASERLGSVVLPMLPQATAPHEEKQEIS